MLHIDSKQSVRYLRSIDAKARAFTFQTFKEKGDTTSTIEPRVIHSNSLNELRREHAAGAGVYLTVNETDGSGRRRSENITRIRAIWSEDDDGYTGEFPLAPSLIVESPEHFHRYWLIADDWPADEKGRADFAAVMERMVTSFGSDANAKDICRVLRVPGFWHRKADNGPVAPFMTRVLDDNGARYTREQILAAFPPVVREQKKTHTEWKPRDDDDKQIREALDYIDPDDRVIWRNVGMALKEHMGEAGRSLWDAWSLRSAKFNERDQNKNWKSFHRHDIKIGTLFHYARQSGWRDEKQAKQKANGKIAGPAEQQDVGVTLDDFHAYMPMHNYIYAPTREMWPASSVNARIPPAAKDVKASAWLDQHRPVEQMTWVPGEPMLITGRLISEGGWIERPGVTCFNLYRPPIIEPGDAAKAGPWLDHLNKVFSGDAGHLLQWFAQRVQRSADKINHAIVLGGAQGIGKDTLLEPVKRAIGPWNFHEVSPQHMLSRFNGFLKSVILRVSEARDLGDIDRFQFYDHLKSYTAAPPDVLRVDEKHIREHAVLNCLGIIITTNHKTDGIYLPADDRRHFVAWSDLTKEQFDSDYWTKLWGWYDNGGDRHVAALLHGYDLTSFDAKAPPPKTQAFWEIVDSSRAPEDAELADAIDLIGSPAALTLSQITARAAEGFAEWLRDRKNARRIPHRLEACGYVAVRNDGAKDGLWKITDRRQVIYAKAELSLRDRIRAAQDIAGGSY